MFIIHYCFNEGNISVIDLYSFTIKVGIRCMYAILLLINNSREHIFVKEREVNGTLQYNNCGTAAAAVDASGFG